MIQIQRPEEVAIEGAISHLIEGGLNCPACRRFTPLARVNWVTIHVGNGHFGDAEDYSHSETVPRCGCGYTCSDDDMQ